MHETTVEISVIIPVYNVEPYLEECVGSVLRQSYRDFEIILVDDGSTDCSGEICDKYREEDGRVRVIHQENGGLSAARNSGLKAAAGKYVYFLDSDDYIEEETLEQLINIAKEEAADVVFFDGYVFFTDCEEEPDIMKYERVQRYTSANGKEVLQELLKNDEYRTAVPLMFFRREYLMENKLWFCEGILHEDELFTFLVYNADGRVSHCHEQLYARRIRPTSIMTSSSMLRRYDSMLRIYLELSDLFNLGKIQGEAGRMYMVRTAKSVLGKYGKLKEADQEKMKEQHQKFKDDVMSHKGFDDLKLKIKCSGKIRNIIYRAENKLINMNRKG